MRKYSPQVVFAGLGLSKITITLQPTLLPQYIASQQPTNYPTTRSDKESLPSIFADEQIVIAARGVKI
jgi:hypothetical protein